MRCPPAHRSSPEPFDIQAPPAEPTSMLTSILQHIDANRQQSLERLKAFLRIPSVSTKPEHVPDMQRCAQFVADELAACGFAPQIFPTAGHPIVLAKNQHQPNRPTILVYG